jgi:hypothetical protein
MSSPSGFIPGTSSTTTFSSARPSAASVARSCASSMDICVAMISLPCSEAPMNTTPGCARTSRSSSGCDRPRGSAMRAWLRRICSRRAMLAAEVIVARSMGRPCTVRPMVSTRTRAEARSRRPK